MHFNSAIPVLAAVATLGKPAMELAGNRMPRDGRWFGFVASRRRHEMTDRHLGGHRHDLLCRHANRGVVEHTISAWSAISMSRRHL
jgi:hypothetical protein